MFLRTKQRLTDLKPQIWLLQRLTIIAPTLVPNLMQRFHLLASKYTPSDVFEVNAHIPA